MNLNRPDKLNFTLAIVCGVIHLYPHLTNVLGEATYDEIPSENVTYEQWLKVCP